VTEQTVYPTIISRFPQLQLESKVFNLVIIGKNLLFEELINKNKLVKSIYSQVDGTRNNRSDKWATFSITLEILPWSAY
jgi:hypothetical protein